MFGLEINKIESWVIDLGRKFAKWEMWLGNALWQAEGCTACGNAVLLKSRFNSTALADAVLLTSDISTIAWFCADNFGLGIGWLRWSLLVAC